MNNSIAAYADNRSKFILNRLTTKNISFGGPRLNTNIAKYLAVLEYYGASKSNYICHPSKYTIAKALGVDKRSLQNYNKILKSKRLLKVNTVKFHNPQDAKLGLKWYRTKSGATKQARLNDANEYSFTNALLDILGVVLEVALTAAKSIAKAFEIGVKKMGDALQKVRVACFDCTMDGITCTHEVYEEISSTEPPPIDPKEAERIRKGIEAHCELQNYKAYRGEFKESQKDVTYLSKGSIPKQPKNQTPEEYIAWTQNMYAEGYYGDAGNIVEDENAGNIQ